MLAYIIKEFFDCHAEFQLLNSQIDEYKFSVLTAATGVGKGILKVAQLFGWKLPKLLSNVFSLWAKIGDKIGQIMIIPYPMVMLNQVDELSTTERGEGGFGSTSPEQCSKN